MLDFILNRPIAVSMSVVAMLIFSLIAYWQLPVSLLPMVEVPRILIKVNYPGASPLQLEENVLRSIREDLLSLQRLDNIDSEARSEQGILELQFAYGTSMSLAFVEINERIDRLSTHFPPGLPRPNVVRINTSDIPIVRLQLLPKEESSYAAISKFTEKMLRKQVEQIEGVSLVDINGQQETVFSVKVNEAKLYTYGISREEIALAIQENNQAIGGISLKDGHYTYYLKMASALVNAKDVENIPIVTKGGAMLRLSELALTKEEPADVHGYHVFAAKDHPFQNGLVITIHKQEQARMPELMLQIEKAVEQFKKDYPQIDFVLTQDQSILLKAGVDNLTSSLMWGGLFAFGVLFLFMADYRVPLIIGISIPASLVLSFSFFWLFDISLNIVSLSGLAIGMGMVIDSAIIVLDNVSRRQAEGVSLQKACVDGTMEVMPSLISSVLTTLAVFIPLIYLNGLTGALFFDQAISVAAILTVSLIVSFTLLPLLYKLLNQKRVIAVESDSKVYKLVQNEYKKLFRFVWDNKVFVFSGLFLMLPLGLFLVMLLQKEGFPVIEKRDHVLKISWNEPLHVKENRARIYELLNYLKGEYDLVEGDIGLQQYILQQEQNQLDEATLYLKFKSNQQKEQSLKQLVAKMEAHFPNAHWQLQDAPSAFDQMFTSKMPFYEVRLSDFSGHRLSPNRLNDVKRKIITYSKKSFKESAGTEQETAVVLSLDYEMLELYDISLLTVKQTLQKLFSNSKIDDIRSIGESRPIIVKEADGDLHSKLKSSLLFSSKGIAYPLDAFVKFQFVEDYKTIVADRYGMYQSLTLSEITDAHSLEHSVFKASASANASVRFSGRYFQDLENLRQLQLILFISMLLLYFILAAQFESLLQPFIVILTIPLGIGGSLFMLWISNNSLNIMSGIGIVVTLGIMVNDAILKVDTINRLRKGLQEAGMSAKSALVLAIHNAGSLRLKPILMTSITTILAVLPILFSSGIGADLQKPLVVSVIGGLAIGTASAIFFLPLLYYFILVKRIS